MILKHIIPYIIILVALLASCQPIKDSKKELICGNDSKTWILDHTTKNGILENNKRPDEGQIRVVFSSNGEMDMGAPTPSQWKIRKNSDTIWFTINSLTTINYDDKILKLNKDTFIIQLITDEQDTIVDYLYHINNETK